MGCFLLSVVFRHSLPFSSTFCPERERKHEQFQVMLLTGLSLTLDTYPSSCWELLGVVGGEVDSGV